MHSHEYGEFYVTHNGDYSGDINIHVRDGTKNGVPSYKLVASLPFWLLAHIVSAKVRQDRIRALENQGYETILGMRPHDGPTMD